MKISIIIPFHNEEENVDAVLNEVRRTNPDSEIIAINDASKDNTLALIQKHTDVRLISFEKQLGQSAAIYAGLQAAQREICVMMDGDGQNDPADIPKLVAALEHADVVCGIRQNRQDVWRRRVGSRLANFIRRRVLHDRIHDTGCTLKALRRADVRHLVPFNGLHRYLAVFLTQAGLKVVEIPVNHRARAHGKSKYSSAGRALRGIYDLIGVRWLMKRRISWPKREDVREE